MIENILAIPSKNRLRDESLQLLSDAGIRFEIQGRQLVAEATLPEMGSFTLALIRPKDIVEMVATGRLPLGITGLDTVDEYRIGKRYSEGVQTILELGIGKCRLVIAAPQDSRFQTSQDIEGAVRYGRVCIATSYPKITQRYFSRLRYNAGLENDGLWEGGEIYNLGGSVEAAPALRRADVISDLVETGRSLRDNGLREIITIFESEAVLITNLQMRKGRNSFVDAIRGRLAAVIP